MQVDDDYFVDIEYLNRLNIDVDFLIENQSLVLGVDSGILYFTTLKEHYLELEQQLSYLANLPAKYRHTDSKIIRQHLENLEQDRRLELIGANNVEFTRTTESQLLIGDEPIVNFIDTLILNAVEQKASDIHFEPYESSFRVRFRLDGMLKEVKKLPLNSSGNIVSRIKVMAKLDISENRLPQDGSMKVRLLQQDWDIRVSSLPTIYGEKIVLRILDKRQGQISIDDLGLTEIQKRAYIEALHKRQGMILITGPTGSGKTLTLYAGLGTINTENVNISTVEDPVEIKLDGINQVDANSKIGLSFSQCLRAFLRQDPDIIMLGEIRDFETAEIAIKAAQTGHLLLSTLHTNSAADTLTRLVNMGIKKYDLADSLNLIIAQRLIRKLCSNCKISITLSQIDIENLNLPKLDLNNCRLYKAGSGCEQCNLGYKGRTGVFEVCLVDAQLRELLFADADLSIIKNKILETQLSSLYLSSIDKFLQGETSLEEVKRAMAGI